MKALDLTGKRFTKLVALERVAGTKPIKWKCVCDCGNEAVVSVSNLCKTNGKSTKSCGCLAESEHKIIIGNSYPTDSSGNVTVIKKTTEDFVLVMFEDGTEVEVTQGNLRAGRVRNPNLKVTWGVGYHGVGPYRQAGTKAHEYWSKMLQRAYSPEYKTAHPTYEKVTVCDAWHNFQNFAEWCTSQPYYGDFGLNLDKDLLVKGNKVYSPDTCVLIPQQINKMLSYKKPNSGLPTGVRKDGNCYFARCQVNGTYKYLGTFKDAYSAGLAYVEEKNREIRRVAEEWKDKIDPRAYEALLNYTVEITD